METLAMLALECRQVMVDNKEALEERLDAINMETEGMRDTKEIESGEEQEDSPGIKTEEERCVKSDTSRTSYMSRLIFKKLRLPQK